MKQGKRSIYALLLAALMVAFVFPPMETKAGYGETVYDTTTLEGGNWNNPANDVTPVEGTLIFPETSTEYTRYITKSSAKIDDGIVDLVAVNATLKFKKLPTGKSFIFGFGLSSVEALPGEEENVEVRFTNAGGIKVDVVAYSEDGSLVTIAQPKACEMSLNSAATVHVKISAEGVITVTVNGRSICSAKLPVTGEGRVGFMQTGGCAAEISNLKVTQYKYDRPENVNIKEGFDSGAMNVAALTAKVLDIPNAYPRGQVVEEYNGNQVLMFKNTGTAYVGTLYQYSNFEMTFDVPFIQLQTEYNEDGSAYRRGMSDFAVAFGGEQPDWDITDGWKKAAETLRFTTTSVYSNNNKQEITATLTEEYFKNSERGFSIKILVVDGVVTVGMKWMDEQQYKTVLSYKLTKGMPMGYIHIWSTSIGMFAVDNLTITNLDENPNLLELEYKSGKWDVPEDATYKPMEKVYETSTVKDKQKEKAISWYLLIPATTIAGAIALGTTAIVTHCKGKKKKEAKADEE